MRGIKFLLLAATAACGGAPAAAPAPAPAAPRAEPGLSAADCRRICSEEMAALATTGAMPPVSPCGPGTGLLEGAVAQLDGKPIEKAFVAAQSSCGMYYGTTGPDGTFSLDGLPAGPYLVAARSQGTLVEAPAEVAAGKPVKVDLRLGAARPGPHEPSADAVKCGCGR